MPKTAAKRIADRANGSWRDAHPRANGGEILLPWDILEGAGDFTRLYTDECGYLHPEGFRLGRVELPDGRCVYIGTSPEAATMSRQNTTSLGMNRPSFVVGQPITPGHAPPGKMFAAEVPKPLPPIVKVIANTSTGYPASSTSSPYWFAYSYVVRGKHILSPAIPFQLGEGQSFQAPIPRDLPEGVNEIGLWLSEPKSATATTTGRMKLQRTLDLRVYAKDSYDFTGPYRNGVSAPGSNETGLNKPGRPRLEFLSERRPARIGTYYALVTFTNERGESLASDQVGPLTIAADPAYGDETPAGSGQFRIRRPSAPSGATGWHAYVLVGGSYHRIWSQSDDQGRTKPFPLSYYFVECAGWDAGDDNHGKNDDNVLISGDPPTENSTEVEAPDSPPEVPVAFGASVPPPGIYYARVTEEYRGIESEPSEAVRVEVGSGQVMRIVFQDRVNKLPNGTYVETTPDRLPLDNTVVTTNGFAYVEDQKLWFGTTSPQEGTTPSSLTDPIKVERDVRWTAVGRLEIKPPDSGAVSGVLQVVLREFTALGVETDTILFSASGVGEHEYEVDIYPTGTLGIDWRSDTKTASILHRLVGTSPVNMATVIEYNFLIGHYYGYRLRPWYPEGSLAPGEIRPRRPRRPERGEENPGIEPGEYIMNRVPQEKPLPPGSSIGIEPPPIPPASPEPPPLTIYPYPEPDRPVAEGEVREVLTFDSSIPASWTQYRTPADATTTLSPSGGKVIFKNTGASQAAESWMSKVFDAGSRHDFGLAANGVTVPVLPSSGRIKWQGLATPGLEAFAWLELGTDVERSTLTFYSGPADAGNVKVTLDGVQTNVAVVASKEVVTMNLTTAPTMGGYVRITLDGVLFHVPVGGANREQVTLDVGSGPNPYGGPNTSGYLNIHLNGVRHSVAVSRTDTRAQVVYKILRASYPGWTAQRGANPFQVYFSANDSGTKTDATFDPGTTGFAGSVMATVVQGGGETAAELVARIREREFPDWIVSGSGATCIFTAVVAGDKTGTHSFSGAATGAVGSVTNTVNGAADTPVQLAARVRAASFPAGWTISGSGTQVFFQSVASGRRQNSRFSAGPTGTVATIETTTQGTDADLIACVKDEVGEIRTRKIITGLTASTLFNIELAVSGAGTTRGIVSFWASFGTNEKTQVARWEELDLTSYPAGAAIAGVTFESAAALNWEIRIDELKVTDRGTIYYCDHNAAGEFINQLVYSGIPTQPIRQDLLVQERVDAILPDNLYAPAAKLRWRGVPDEAPAQPLYLTAHGPAGKTVELGCVTGGIAGHSGWREVFFPPFIAPEDCYELRWQSRDIGEGEIVIQEVVASPGDTPKRTYRYATTGFYRATLEATTPDKLNPFLWGRGTTNLETDALTPEGTEVVTAYRSGDTRYGPFQDWQSYASPILDLPILQIHHDLSGNGSNTPEVRPLNPLVEYDLLTGMKPLATFLQGDRSELPGGAIFSELQEWTRRPEIGVRRLPGGRIYRQQTYEPVGYLPPSKVQVFSREAKTYIEERWGTEEFALEDDGEYLVFKLSAQPEFKRMTPGTYPHDSTSRQALYVADLAPCEVVEAGRLP